MSFSHFLCFVSHPTQLLVRQSYQEKKALQKKELEAQDKEHSQRLIKKVNRDKEANLAAAAGAPATTKTQKKKKRAESTSTGVIKPHIPFTPRPTKKTKKDLLDCPPAPQKDRRSTIEPADLETLAPRVSQTTADSGANYTNTTTDKGKSAFTSFSSCTIGIGHLVEEFLDSEFELFTLNNLEGDMESQDTKGKEKLQNSLQKAKDKIKELKEEASAAATQLENQGREISSLFGQVEELQKIVETAAAKKGKGGKELGKKLTQASQEIAALKTQNAVLTRDNKTLFEAEEKWKERVKKLKETNKEIGTELTKLKEAIPSEAEAPTTDGLLKQINELEEKNLKLDATVATHEGTIKKLQASKDLLKSLEKQVADLKKENKAATIKIKALEEKVEPSQQRVLQLEAQVKEQDTEIKTLKRDARASSRGTDSQTPSQDSSTRNSDGNTPNDELEKLRKENKSLKTSNAALTESLKKAKEALKDGGKFMASEVSAAVTKKIKKYVRDVVFHQTKFLSGDSTVKDYMTEIYDGLKNDPELMWTEPDSETHKPFDEFCRVYEQHCRETLNNRRQYVQTQCVKAAVGMFYPKLCVVNPYLNHHDAMTNTNF